jgi:muramoyltetrapeptide carboxypeptidase LdcA involved in peptidoglycan recycling
LNTIFPLRISRAKDFLISQGFSIREIFTDPLPSSSYTASAKARAAELHAAFSDRSVRAIVCTIGGLCANELLPHVDYELVARNPKIFVGYSDITLLHHALYVGAGLRTFYGPSAICQFGEFPKCLDFTWEHFLHVLQGAVEGSGRIVGHMPRSKEWTDEFLDWNLEFETQKKGLELRARQMKPSRPWKWLRGGKAEGRIFGGCLPSMLQLFGTPWEVSYRDRILLLELPEGFEPSKPWPPEFARWNMGDLVTRGVIAGIKGLVLGRPYAYSDNEEMFDEWERTVLDACEGTDFPILANVDVGHSDPMLTVPLDAMVWLESEADVFAVLEPAVAVPVAPHQ